MNHPLQRPHRWDQIGFGLVSILVFLIPWGDMLLLPMEVQASRVFTLAATAAWIPLLWRRRKMRPLESPHILMLLFVLWAGINIMESAEPERTLRRVLSYMQLFLDAWIIHQCLQSAGRLEKLLAAWLLGCYVCAAGVLYNFSRNVYQGDGRYTAPGFDPNDLAVTLVLGIPVAWYLSLRNLPYKWIYRLYMPFAIAAILLTASRGALVTLSVVLLYPLTTIPKTSAKALAGIVLLAVLSSAAVMQFSSEISFRRLSTIADQLSARDLNGRIDIWQRGYEAFLERPLMGAGAGGFGTAVGARRGRELAAHNTLLGILVEHGLIGLALFLGICLALLRRTRRMPPPEARLWFFLLLGWGVAVTTLSWENREMTWLLWGLCAAGAIRIRKRVPQTVLWRYYGPVPSAS